MTVLLNEWHLADVITYRIGKTGIAYFDFKVLGDKHYLLSDFHHQYELKGNESIDLFHHLINDLNFILEIEDNELLVTRPNINP